jgi:hypothetical protein
VGAVVSLVGHGLAPAWHAPSSNSADAVDALRLLVAAATQLLVPAYEEERTDQGPQGVSSAHAARRVARLRNELHVTANRVARFGFDAHPTVDVVRIPPTTAAGALLAPSVVLYRLGLTVDRLARLIGRLPAVDWERVGLVGDRQVTLGAIVDEALQAGFDLLRLQSPPEARPDRAERANP